MGTVSYRAQFTRNMGNYESLQLSVGVEDEPRGEETHASAFNRVKDFVESRLLDDITTLEEDIIKARRAVVDKERQRKIEVAAVEQKDETEV